MSVSVNNNVSAAVSAASAAATAAAAALATSPARGNAGGPSGVVGGAPQAVSATNNSSAAPELDPPIGGADGWDLVLQSMSELLQGVMSRSSKSQANLAIAHAAKLLDERIEQQRKAWRSADKAKRKLFGIRIKNWVNMAVNTASFLATASTVGSKVLESNKGCAFGGFMATKGIVMMFNLAGAITEEVTGEGFSFESICRDVMGDTAGTIYAGVFSADISLIAKGIAMSGTKDEGDLAIVAAVFKVLETLGMVAAGAAMGGGNMSGYTKLLLATVAVGTATTGITQGTDTMELAEINKDTANARTASDDAARQGDVQTDQIGKDLAYVASIQRVLGQLIQRMADVLSEVQDSRSAAIGQLHLAA